CGVALAGGVHLAHGFQVQRNARGVLDEAARLEQEGRLAEAANDLESYLGLRPDDAGALARFGLLLDRLARTPRERERAVAALGQALHRDGQRADVRRQLARRALEAQQWSEAQH